MQASTDPLLDIAFRRHAQELCDSWQGKVLARALVVQGGVGRARGLPGAAVLSVLAHNFDNAMPVLLRVVFPDWKSIGSPMLCSAARIAKTGDVMADMIGKDGQFFKNQQLFRNTRRMESAFRRVADEARLDDKQRVEFFEAVKRWVVCDYRLDPTMNPDDPDAKRLTIH